MPDAEQSARDAFNALFDRPLPAPAPPVVAKPLRVATVDSLSNSRPVPKQTHRTRMRAQAFWHPVYKWGVISDDRQDEGCLVRFASGEVLIPNEQVLAGLTHGYVSGRPNSNALKTERLDRAHNVKKATRLRVALSKP